MPVYSVSFRIAEHGDHGGRYRSLTDKIEEIAGPSPWKETTSYYVIETDMSLTALTAKIVLESDYSPIYDHLMVIDLRNGDYAVRGPMKTHPQLAALMARR